MKRDNINHKYIDDLAENIYYINNFEIDIINECINDLSHIKEKIYENREQEIPLEEMNDIVDNQMEV